MRVYQNDERISMDAGTDSGPAAMVERLRLASNDHDIEAVAGCFAADYRNETPVHPQRGFTGRDQVRRNWEQIFAAIPDLTVKVLRCAVDGTQPGRNGNTAVPGPMAPGT
jgi:ketosteroid isomerase-like protein